MKFGNIFCSTIIRGSSDRDMTGFFYHLDWDAKRVIRKVPVPAATKEIGSRGGSRGGRGMLYRDGYLYATGCDRVLVYDRGWEIVDQFIHPQIIGHHDLQEDKDGFWCTSTMIDALFKLDWTGRIIDEWYGSESHDLIKAFDGDELPMRYVYRSRKADYVTGVDLESADVYDEQLHLNTLDIHDHKLYTFSNRKYSLIQILPHVKIIQRNPRWLWAHNVIIRGKKIFVNNSNMRRFEIYDIGADMPELSVLLDETDAIATQFSTSGWVRGMAFYDDRYVFVGSSPSVVFLLDTIEGRVVDKMRISDQVNDTVHGITLEA